MSVARDLPTADEHRAYATQWALLSRALRRDDAVRVRHAHWQLRDDVARAEAEAEAAALRSELRRQGASGAAALSEAPRHSLAARVVRLVKDDVQRALQNMSFALGEHYFDKGAEVRPNENVQYSYFFFDFS